MFHNRFFWWIYQPADEREQQLYLLAYRRSALVFLQSTLAFLVIYALDIMKSGVTSLPSSGFFFTLGLVGIALGLVASALVFPPEMHFTNRVKNQCR